MDDETQAGLNGKIQGLTFALAAFAATHPERANILQFLTAQRRSLEAENAGSAEEHAYIGGVRIVLEELEKEISTLLSGLAAARASRGPTH